MAAKLCLGMGTRKNYIPSLSKKRVSHLTISISAIIMAISITTVLAPPWAGGSHP